MIARFVILATFTTLVFVVFIADAYAGGKRPIMPGSKSVVILYETNVPSPAIDEVSETDVISFEVPTNYLLNDRSIHVVAKGYYSFPTWPYPNSNLQIQLQISYGATTMWEDILNIPVPSTAVDEGPVWFDFVIKANGDNNQKLSGISQIAGLNTATVGKGGPGYVFGKVYSGSATEDATNTNTVTMTAIIIDNGDDYTGVEFVIESVEATIQ